jgi:hypothetical protein
MAHEQDQLDLLDGYDDDWDDYSGAEDPLEEAYEESGAYCMHGNERSECRALCVCGCKCLIHGVMEEDDGCDSCHDCEGFIDIPY